MLNKDVMVLLEEPPGTGVGDHVALQLQTHDDESSWSGIVVRVTEILGPLPEGGYGLRISACQEAPRDLARTAVFTGFREEQGFRFTSAAYADGTVRVWDRKHAAAVLRATENMGS